MYKNIAIISALLTLIFGSIIIILSMMEDKKDANIAINIYVVLVSLIILVTVLYMLRVPILSI